MTQRLAVVLLTLTAFHAASARSQVSQATEEKAGPDLITPDRIRAVRGADRVEWGNYLRRSDLLRTRDHASMQAALKGSDTLRLPPYSAPDFPFGERPDAWLATDSARSIANAVLTFQTPSGGWSKRTDMTSPRGAGVGYYAETRTWHYIPTFDNGATTGQVRFLGRMSARDTAYAAAFRRGMDLVLDAQMPNGCWPQSYPLNGGYHDAVTFNDNTIVLILRLLNDVTAGNAGPAPAELREKAKGAARRGVGCITNSQVVINGVRTVWGQQHDPFTLQPIPARSYELAGLAGRESAEVMKFLMTLEAPSPQVVAAVHAAARWFSANWVEGPQYDPKNGVTYAPSAGRVWARLTEIGTGRAIFANRDGKKLYDWRQLTDRRVGYAWFGDEPTHALRLYEHWARKHPGRTISKQDRT